MYRDHLPPRLKTQLAQKVAASELFNHKKLNYPNSIAYPFVEDRLNTDLKMPFENAPHFSAFANQLAKLYPQDGKKFKYVALVTKFDRTTYKARERIIVCTNKAIYVLIPENFKINARIDFAIITVCEGREGVGLADV